MTHLPPACHVRVMPEIFHTLPSPRLRVGWPWRFVTAGAESWAIPPTTVNVSNAGSTRCASRWPPPLDGKPDPLRGASRIYARKAGDSSSRTPLARLPDWPEMAVWQAWRKPGALFVDIGANVGLYTLLATECGSEVIAIEPVNATAAALRRNLDLNGIVHGVHVEEVALLNRNGTAVLEGRTRTGSPQGGLTTEGFARQHLMKSLGSGRPQA